MPLNDSIASKIVSGDQLSFALKLLYGPDGDFRSSAQRELVQSLFNNRENHTLVISHPGSGKSDAAAIFLILAFITAGKESVFFCVPYTTLMEHLRKRFERTLNNANNYKESKISKYSGSSITKKSIPPEFIEQPFSLPDCSVLTLDALSNLLTHWESGIRRIVESGNLKVIFVDEIHLILTESKFRLAYG